MTMPRVSVCIVTYNHERYIHDCLMTVVAQAGDISLEILVGDDRSTDRTEEIVRALVAQFPSVIRYFRHENQLGPGRNYQFLIGQAVGEYIAHLDGDDYWLPGKLERQVSLLDSDKGVIACYTNALCIDDSGVPLGVFNNLQPERFEIKYLLKNGNFLNHSSLIYRSGAGKEICGWPPSFLDYKIHLMLASKGQLGYVNSFGVVYRVNSVTSMVMNQGEKVRTLYWEAICHISLERGADCYIRSASADFLRRIAFRAIRMRSISFFLKWWKVVSATQGGNTFRLALLTIIGIVFTGYRMAMTRFAAIVGGARLRVLYWR
jgi:glycosyltransferase involved in cell wall biosynthesis